MGRLVKGAGASLLALLSLIEIGSAFCVPASRIDADTSTNRLAIALKATRWVAYSPTGYDPSGDGSPTRESLALDLRTLSEAGFGGIVTYRSFAPLIGLCEASDMRVILGVWDPGSDREISEAEEVAPSEAVVGFVVGNEGLDVRYNFAILERAIDRLKRNEKPVTTSEQADKYFQSRLAELGDWVFPNAHPYWNGAVVPRHAVRWTETVFDRLTSLTDKPVMLKEVGLPSGGDPRVSEALQAEYYRLLSRTEVSFVWFEAFDQPWKTHAAVEPFWGLFRKDRSPKAAAFALGK